MVTSAWTDNNNRLALKNLAVGTTEESLTKVLLELEIKPTKIFLVNFDKEICAQICFPDYQSCKSLFAKSQNLHNLLSRVVLST